MGSKAIGPHVGWIGGYALILSSILAGVRAAGILTNAAAVWAGMDNSTGVVRRDRGLGVHPADHLAGRQGAEESSRR